MKQIIDIDKWERKENFNFFRNFVNPTISITCEVQCGGAKTRAKQAKQSFFLHYLYAVLRAVNEIKEFRYRIDREGRVVLYDKVEMLTPIKINDEGKFFTAQIPYTEDFNSFHEEAQRIIRNIPKDGNPYDAEAHNPDNEDFDIILLSATPDLYFTSFTCTQEFRHGSNYPLMNAGKAVTRGGELVMPIAMTIHHGFIDGHHISLFYKKIEEFLK